MKTFTKLSLALLLLGSPAARTPAASILTVAVFDFESRDEATKDIGPKAATLISATLSAKPGIETVERAELEKVLSEHELGLSGNVSTESAAKVGHLTGAKVLVTGRVFKADKELVMVAKIIGTETSRVYGEVVKGAASGSFTDLASDLGKKIATTVRDKGETLVAKVKTREERLTKIKNSVQGAKLPSIEVKIQERHFGGAVIDPAAQTEIGLLLQQAGFKLVDERSSDKADVEITGEAFSAFGIRKGNLISCKSRVEIKAQKRDGEILSVDRETGVAVDIAEQSAAKAALQEAAGKLAERLAPKLVK